MRRPRRAVVHFGPMSRARPSPASVRSVACAFALSLAAATAGAAGDAAGLRLHVPSPDWRDQVLYFVMTDRFADGDPRNNDQGAGEYRPGDRTAYQGGDLAGLRRRLDYIQGLGATGLWITPPVLNQWMDGTLGYAGYHGYWASHFARMDPHVGTLHDYRRLSDALHRRGMVLVQDIVVNHVGNYFGYAGGWDPADPARFWTANPSSRPTAAPTQPPFHLNDPRRAADRRAGIYHWTPAVADYNDPKQVLTYQMSNLDDLATDQPAVRRALRESYGHWIRSVGVDAYRVDTAFYVDPGFFEDFRFARDPLAPGIDTVARRTGRRDFLVFGEGFVIDPPGGDAGARRIESYMHGPDGRPRMNGMLNFPLYGALADTFSRGRPAAVLGDRITRMVALHPRLHTMPSFLDNHDVDRWLAAGDEAGLRQALLALTTLPGIPVLYYGTEQGFTEPRASMFAAGWGSGGRDRFDTASPLYRYIAGVTALRRAQPVLSRGVPTVLRADETGPGVVAWRTDATPASGLPAGTAPVLVAFNTADGERLVDALPTGAPPGSRLRGLFSVDGRPVDAVADARGQVTLRLPARGGVVWRIEPAVGSAATAPAAEAATIVLDPLPATPVTGDFQVTGRAAGTEALALVVDGDLARATTVRPGPDGRFAATVSASRMTDPALVHRVVAWAEGRAVSAPLAVRAELPWRVLADVADPTGDDTGPGAQPQPRLSDDRYRYPTDPTFEPRQMDIEQVRVRGAGGALQIDVRMRSLTESWSPANGFDHVAFALYLELPPLPDGRRPEGEGARVMPGQHASLPGDLRWHRRLRAHGWGVGLFDPRSASATDEGTPVSPGATVSVDRPSRTVRFKLPAAALGDRPSLSGARLWLTTWDWDGGWRALAAEPGPFTMGGGAGDRPRVMDASAVIVLP